MIFSCVSKIPVHRIEKVLFGIGNPGYQYVDTRHNIGFAAVDRMAGSLKDRREYRGNGWILTVGYHGGIGFGLVKPTTFVNLSGQAFADVLSKTGCPLPSCMVIVDDYHLALGSIRIKPKGSDGGHNGLKSIIGRVGEGFSRLRFGIGPLPDGIPSVDFVLGKFADSEMPAVSAALQTAQDALLHWASCGIDSAMNKFNP